MQEWGGPETNWSFQEILQAHPMLDESNKSLCFQTNKVLSFIGVALRVSLKC